MCGNEERMRDFRGLWELSLWWTLFHFILYSLVKQATTGPVVHLVMLQYEILNEENISCFDFTPLDD